MSEREGGLGGFALGSGIGAFLWNGIFLGLSALGVITPDLAWLGIKLCYGGALFWVALGILHP